MKSSAVTVPAYLASLPPERRGPIETVRRLILDNLDPVLQERMQYGVIAYTVPHSGKGGWPHGHHTNPKLPLMYMGLSSQKNDMVVYMLMLYQNEPMRAWFDKAWKATGRKNHLEVTGAGCCLRFKKVEDLAPDVIADAMRRVSVPKYLENHTAVLARMGRGPDGKPLKKDGRGTHRVMENRRPAKTKTAPPNKKKKTSKKPASNRR